MKKWTAVAGTLAMLMGISGAALAEDRDHRDQDWRNNGAYGYQVDHRDNYRTYGYPNYHTTTTTDTIVIVTATVIAIAISFVITTAIMIGIGTNEVIAIADEPFPG